MKNLGIFCLLLLLVFSSCRQEERAISIETSTPSPGLETYTPKVSNINAGVIGFVVNENNEPLADAMVTVNSTITTTDQYGHFFIENATLNALGALVKVEKAGYFAGSRRFFPIEGNQSRVKIQLLEKNFDATFEASNGGNITLNSGAALEFAANTIVDASGAVYSGTVRVAGQWMDPSAFVTLDQMPGNLQGVNRVVEDVALGTYGMLAVELEGDNGEALNIAEGSGAIITMPVPASMLSSAPAQIPLWAYDETLGLWIEESTASLQGNSYVGEVGHFSFWNCDIPFEYVNLEMTLIDDNEHPLNNYLVTLTIDNTSGILTSGSGYTDQNGNVSGVIPANEMLTMEVLDACGYVLFAQAIGPFDMDTNLGNKIISGAGVNSTTVSGNLLDCNGNPLTNGLVSVSFAGQVIYHYPSTASFSLTFPSCASTEAMEVRAINPNEMEQSDPISLSPNSNNDLGDINACGGPLENYVSITINGESHTYPEVSKITTSSQIVYIYSQGDTFNVGIGFLEDASGQILDVFFRDIRYDPLGWNFSNPAGSITNDILILNHFEVTQDDVMIKGNFSGELTDGNGDILPMSGFFSVSL